MNRSELDLPAAEAPTVEETSVVRNLERQLAVAHWLLSAAEDRDLVRAQWEDGGGVALLACGGTLGAVRVPAGLVWAAAGTEELKEVDAFLCRWFFGGAVFMDLHSHLYYFLVPGTAAVKWTGAEFPGVACLGRNHFLGVPAVRLTEPRGRSYWCVPMDGPGDLCYISEVWQLLRKGLAARQETPCAL
ncbi:hypothetical protein [Streptomyces sp. NPDC000931]|uniref:hypothetical protein n=1 Tax=Streptomyces sp. NPDC000931 TaxID=3154372 RepID=UPI00332824A7